MSSTKAGFVAIIASFVLVGGTSSDRTDVSLPPAEQEWRPSPDFWGKVNDYLSIKTAMLSGHDQVMVSNSSWIKVCDNFTTSVEASLDLGERFLSALRIDPTIAVSKALYNLLDCPSSVFEGTKCLISSLANLRTVLKPIISAGLPYAKEALQLIPEVGNSYKACFYS